MKKAVSILLLGILVFVSGCIQKDNPTEKTINIKPNTMSTLEVGGDALQLTAEVIYSDGKAAVEAVTWKSANTAIATVSANGLVTPVASGVVKIAAYKGNISGSVSLIVTPKISTLNIATGDIEINKPTTLKLRATYSDGTIGDVYDAVWKVSIGATTIAPNTAGSETYTITKAGIYTVQGQKLLNGVVKATTSKSITVYDPRLAESIVIEGKTSIYIDDESPYIARATFKDKTTAVVSNVTWVSLSTPYATVDTNGIVKGVSSGTTVIKATMVSTADVASSVFATKSVTVSAPEVVNVMLASTRTEVATNQAVYLTANLVKSNTVVEVGLSDRVSWATSDANVATVDADGKVTGVAVGEAVITASYKLKTELKDTKTIKVIAANAPKAIAITAPINLEKGLTAQLKAEVTYANDQKAIEPVTWSVDVTTRASVGATSGVLTGIEKGQVVVKAEIGSVSTTALVNIIDAVTGDKLRVHYNRYNGDYSGWGLHLWPGFDYVGWSSPVLFTSSDDYGVYADIALTSSNDINYIVHKGDSKDGGDRIIKVSALTANAGLKEIWVKEGRADYYTSKPSNKVKVRTAYIQKANTIVGKLSANVNVVKDAFEIKDMNGVTVGIKSLAVTGSDYVLETTTDLDFAKNYKIYLSDEASWVMYDTKAGGILDTDLYYAGNDLGATYNNGGATIKLWSPPATKIMVNVFDKGRNSNVQIGTVPMERGANGVWTAIVKPSQFGVTDLDGYYYQYEVTAYGKTTIGLDPYAKSLAAYDPNGADKIGKAAIINPAKVSKVSPIGNYKIMSSRTDAIIYEMHVRDFTIDPASGVTPALRGTYKGFEEKIPYLKELGITHVQLMPVQDFRNVNETDRAYKVGSGNYNWGYDPMNYFAPEGWFATDATDPYARVNELKSLIKALHDAGIGVLIDVVYNHTVNPEVFENIAPGCYYRYNDSGTMMSNVGPVPETRRLMMRRIVVESMKMFAEEYGADGFRFDIMGHIDNATMRAVRASLGNDSILHGEAWDGDEVVVEAKVAPLKAQSYYPHDIELGAFSDTARNAFGGNESYGAKGQEKGFIQGKYDTAMIQMAKLGIVGNLKGFPQAGVNQEAANAFAVTPAEALNYPAIHDGFALWDKFNLSTKTTSSMSLTDSMTMRAKLVKMNLAMMFTSQGRLITHGGDEIGRTKPYGTNSGAENSDLGGDYDQADEGFGKTIMRNSYKFGDFTNMVRWDRNTNPIFTSLKDYYKGLIKMRRAIPGFRYEDAYSIKNGVSFRTKVIGSAPDFPTTCAGMKINFTNAPTKMKGKTWYLVGEVYGGTNQNPDAAAVGGEGNLYKVAFDANGSGSISFSALQVSKMLPNIWTRASQLEMKFVDVAGSWTSQIEPGVNISIFSNYVLKDLLNNADPTNKVLGVDTAPITIDMSGAGEYQLVSEADQTKSIDYIIDNGYEVSAFNGGTPYKKFVVIHNADVNPYTMKDIAEITTANLANCDVILDEDDAGTTALTYTATPTKAGETSVKVEAGQITVPAKSSTVVGIR